ncbi:MAG: Hsp20/alpha crystallin family protein [Spirochaetales bacterium]|nr:Hsp20/alpha crystallin family protein [Spirochaetales bacterium]MBR2317466.1 Hsp20/alpha crystallin family protein [Spirochaetales bacterium]
MNTVDEKKDIESTRGYIYATPLTDIIENKNAFEIIFDLPGIEKDDIKINIEKDILTITAESSFSQDEDFHCIHKETNFSGFRRAFNLNKIIDNNKVEAQFNNGTLTLILPKKAEEQSKEISINIG